MLRDVELFDLVLAAASGDTPLDAARESFRQRGGSDLDARAFEDCVEVFRTLKQGPEPAAPGACLDENRLAEYVDRVLARDERAAAESHMAACPGCLRRMAALATLVREVTPPLRPAAVLIALARKGLSLLSYPEEGFRLHTLQPVAVLAGPAEAPAACRWSQADGDIAATFTVLQGQGGTVSLTAEVLHRNAPPRRARMDLRAAGSLVESCLLPAHGTLTLYELPPDSYQLTISIDGAAATFAIELMAQ